MVWWPMGVRWIWLSHSIIYRTEVWSFPAPEMTWDLRVCHALGINVKDNDCTDGRRGQTHGLKIRSYFLSSGLTQDSLTALWPSFWHSFRVIEWEPVRAEKLAVYWEDGCFYQIPWLTEKVNVFAITYLLVHLYLYSYLYMYFTLKVLAWPGNWN